MKQTSIADFIEDGLKDEVTDFNNPSCTNCNECCSMGVMLLPEEYKKLKKYLLNDNTGKTIYNDAVNRIKKYSKGGTIYWMCPFSNSNKKCSIYNIRPSICRDFHCKKELSENYNRAKYEEKEHFIMFDLFKKYMVRK